MSRVLYFDCSSGASGDMVLGALVDLGVPVEDLRRALADLLPGGCDLSATRVLRSGIAAMKVDLVEPAPPAGGAGHAHAPHRGLGDILALIGRARLPEPVKQQAQALFERIGRVEAEIHQVPVEQVHFHEVGALDSIVDIVGAVWAIHHLEADRVVASALNVGSGTVQTSHGRLPVPAPATIRLLEGVPIYSSGIEMELVTPTGALLVAGHATSFGPLPPMRVIRTGYGAGTRDLKGQPNALRVVLGEDWPGGDTDRVFVMECNIDDMNPQFFGGAMDRLYAAGALDVFYAAVQMKKNRPGTLVTVIVPPQAREAVRDVLFRETTTIGVREHEAARACLARAWVTVQTPYGPVRMKIASRNGTVMNAAPEYEECAALAAEHGVPVKAIHAAAVGAYLHGQQGERHA